MSDKIEIQGKTVEAAVSEALLQMGARRDEVEIKVLEEPKSGFMGFLGGRAARVLVRKKQSRRRGRSDRDHRSNDDNYKAHNLSEGGSRGRGGSRRRPAGKTEGSSSNRAASGGRDDSRQEPRGEKSGSRRGSRGRGGRGRNQNTDNRNQQQGERNNSREQQPVRAENQEQSRERSSGGRSRNDRSRRGPDNRQGGRQDNRQDNRQDKRQDKRRDNRQEVRQDQRSDQQVEQPAAARNPERNGNERNQRNQRNQRGGERNQRREAPAPVPVEPVVAAPVVQPEKKEEASVAKPINKKRSFGGLGARLKERKAAEKAAEKAAREASAVAEAPAPVPTQEVPRAAEIPRDNAPAPAAPEAPRYEKRAPERHTSSRSSSGYGDEMILGGIKAGKYAKQVGEVTEEGLDDTLTELTDAMLARAGFPCRCETHPGEYRQIKVTTDDASAGMLIGRHGQTVDAVEHLVERMASNAIDARARINLDINNYRMHREEALVERISEAADKIRETGRPFHMEPMSARERRIIHLEAEAFGGLRTFTMDGSGGKHVVIALDEPAEEAAAEQPDTAGQESNDDGSGESNNY